jgi:transcriptional regulator with XRE-family HTH domain
MKQKTAGERIRELRGGMSQADFGQLLDSSQGAVSAWERDDKDRSPSAAVYFRLAALARNPEDVTFFLEQAGLDENAVISVADTLLKKGGVKMEAILSTAEDKLRDRMEDQKALGDEGKIVLVPPFPGDILGAEQSPPPLPVPSFFLPHIASAFYTVVQPPSIFHRAGSGLAPGDYVVFDASDTSIAAVQASLGEEWLARLSGSPDYPGGLFLGRAGLVSTGRHHYLFLGPHDEHPSNFGGPEQSPGPYGNVLKVWGVRYMELAIADAPKFDSFYPSPGYEILGRHVARFTTGAIQFWKQAARRV